MKQLERLYFLQGQRCFFCGQPIPPGEASVEHLVASSNGGAKEDENCVVCCKTVNLALGHLSMKAKLQAVLNQRGGFQCPASFANLEVSPMQSLAPKPNGHSVGLVVADLLKRGSARPRCVSTLKNTMNAVFKMSLTDTELDLLLADLVAKRYVIVEDTKVSYALPTPGT